MFQDSQDSFFVADVGRVMDLYDFWKESFPKIHPFYAVKCNSDPVLLKLLASLGTGFDCATKVRSNYECFLMVDFEGANLIVEHLYHDFTSGHFCVIDKFGTRLLCYTRLCQTSRAILVETLVQ